MAPMPKRTPAKKRSGGKQGELHPPHARPRKADARWHARALKLDGARDAPYPHGFKPQLTDHRDSAPDGARWLHEIKWDGYRLLADLHDGEVKLRSRNGLDWTDDFPKWCRRAGAAGARCTPGRRAGGAGQKGAAISQRCSA
jgi:bifunctional non-homologous end joining protein LigD